MPRCSVTEQVYREITDVFYYHPDHFDYHRITAKPSHCRSYRRFTAITVGSPRLRLIPVIADDFLYTYQSVPKFVVIICVHRQASDVFHFCPDYYRGAAYQTRLRLKYGIFLLPSRPLPRLLSPNKLTSKLPPFLCRPLPLCLVTEQVCSQINATVHFRPDRYQGGSLPNKFIIKIPVLSTTVPTITIAVVFPRL